ncbi:endonuclease III-like protein 1 [Apostichopus japonicus]|uniref:endonuclease III-like protein 1 n=1 Tax=Stichopus japonicus TaxID=307972 RepID=UPI003AB7E0C6
MKKAGTLTEALGEVVSSYFSHTSRMTRSKFSRSEEKMKNQPQETLSEGDRVQLSRLKPKIKSDPDDTAVKNVVKRKHVPIQYETEVKVKKEPREHSEETPWEPLNWKEQLLNMHEMRKNKDAPVDVMGCNKLQDDDADPKVRRYQVLISLMLSSQTKDQVTSAAMMKLRTHGLSVPSILQTSDKKLGDLIYPVGFWKKKIIFIKNTTKILEQKYDSDIPPTLRELVQLPGVGPKMAHIVMDVAWGELTGIGVDTHVHRICNRLKWVQKPTKQPEDTRKAVEKWLPRDKWREINVLMVGFGQQVCLPVGPRCHECLNRKICPHGKGVVKSPKKSPAKKSKPS